MTDENALQRREAELEAKLQSRKTTSQLQSEALRGERRQREGDVTQRQARALRRSLGGDDDE